MKVDIINNKIVLYLRKELIKNVDFNNLEILEKYFKKLVIKLNNIYNVKIEGLYNIKVFLDEIFGAVLEIEPENIDYYLTDEVEMRIMVFNEKFLYEINDIFNINNTKIIKRCSKYYLNVNNNIKLKDYLFILENSKIIYKNTDSIINYGSDISYFILNKIVI